MGRRARHVRLDSWNIDDREGEASKSSTADRLAGGNFEDLERLLEQLGAPPVFELGKPLPDERFMLRTRVGTCPAAHNRALLDEDAA
jgi:hypothetical protein